MPKSKDKSRGYTSDTIVLGHNNRQGARSAAVAAILLTALQLACGGGDATRPVDNSVARVDVSPASTLALVSGTTGTLTGTPFTKDNRALSATAVTWTSSNDLVASVAGGVVTARLVGTASITATSGGISSAGVTVTVSPGAATQLALRAQPVAGTAYAPFTTAAVVELRDPAGNVANTSATVTAAIASGDGVLGGSSAVTAVDGVATFTTLTINGGAGARSLTFSSGALTAVTSTSFNVAAAPPAVIAIASPSVPINAQFGASSAAVNILITNGGVFPLTNLRVQSVTYSPLVPGGWLTTTLSSANAPTFLILTAATAALPVGTYTAGVVVVGDGAAATASLTVTLVVGQLITNTYGTPANKVSIVSIGSSIAPTVVTTQSGVVTTTDPSVAFVSRSPSTALVNSTGRISAVSAGQVWVVATSAQHNADSVLIIVPRSAGPVLRTDLTNYGYRVGDTVTVHVQVDTRGALVGAVTLTFTWPVFIGANGVSGALRFIDVTTAGSPMAPQTTVDQALNVLRITGASVSGATGLVELATVRFRVARSGNNALFVNAIELLAADFTDLLPTATFTQYPVIVP